MYSIRIILAILICFISTTAFGQHPVETPEPARDLASKTWDAFWIAPPNRPARVYGVYHFRKVFELETSPPRFVVNVSADNRYRLFVNGAPVHIGPARGDKRGWRFDTLDLAPWIKPGRNVLAVQVWNFAEHGPVAQVTDQTAFILQGNGAAEAVVNTDRSWRALRNEAYRPITDARERLWTYIVVGPGDDVDGEKYPWGWEEPEQDDSGWQPALELRRGNPRGLSTDGIWPLVARQIPLMESTNQRFHSIRRTQGVSVPERFLQGQESLIIPANTKAKILLDQGVLTTAFPELRTTGGAQSRIQLTYAESLYEGEDSPASNIKGHRDEVDGKHIRGFIDIFRPDGEENRLFRPLRWRTWRYLELEVETAGEPLTLLDLRSEFTAYPFEETAKFQSNDEALNRLWDMAWRTLRTGSHEIFTDSPYYEQLSYVGDSRIEALVSLYVSGDDRLMRKTIEAFDLSRGANGLTASRWPDARHQLIPPYSLVWIAMVHDYWMLDDNPEFVRERLPGIREVLRYFAEHSDERSGSYRVSEWWNFVDWIEAWGKDPVTRLGGVPPTDDQKHSAILDMQHVYSLQLAAALFEAFDDERAARTYRQRADRIRQHVEGCCWDAQAGLLADTSEKSSFSEHANAFWILTAPDGDDTIASVAQRVSSTPNITPATFYFSFYTHRALARAGQADDYLQWLESWLELLDQGLTTIPERPSPDTRSDSHAWGSHPILGMLGIVCGIQPASDGFSEVLIEPHLGALEHVNCAMPHPRGLIEVQLNRTNDGGLSADVTLPEGIKGAIIWRQESRALSGGRQAWSWGQSQGTE